MQYSMSGFPGMAELIASFDWTSTPLDAIASWPQSLRTAVDIMLGSGHAMQLAWGPQRTVLYNDAYAPMLGNRHPGALGLPFREAWPDIWEEIEPLVERVFAGETVRYEDMPLVMTRHGYPEDTWWNFSYSPVRDESGAVAGLLNVTVDATPKVRADIAERALRASEQRLRNVLDGMDEAFGLMDHDFRIITQNRAALRLDGRPLEEIQGRTHWEVYPGSRDTELGRLYQRALADRAPVSLEHRYEWPGREANWFEMRAYPVPEGLAVFWRDISERKRVETALLASEQRLRQFGEASQDVLWIRDAQTLQWQYLTPAFEAIYGLTREEALAGNNYSSWLELIVPEDRLRAGEAIERVRNGEHVTFDYRIRRPVDGTIRWIRSTDFPIADAAGKVALVGGVGHDLTDLRELQERQRVLVAELQHRTRNLLGVVRSMSENTVRSSIDLVDFRDRFGDRLEALSRVQGLLSRLNEHDRVTFDELIRVELSAMHGSCERVTLSGPEGVRLRSSMVQTLAMALHELATNAVKYGALGQPKARLAVDWRVETSSENCEPWLRIDWRESGVEMPDTALRGAGQGRELIERALPYQLGAQTAYSLNADGVHCEISIPVSTTNQDPEHG